MGTISKALELLNFFAPNRSEIGLSDFVRLSKRDKATVHRHLSELTENGFLEQDLESRAYRLGPALVRLAALREALFPVRKLLQPIVLELSEEVGELAHASLLQEGAMSPLVHADPKVHGVQVHFDIAELLPLHATSSGIAALAFSPTALQEKACARPLAKYTGHTLTDPDAFRRALEEARRFGLCTLKDAFEDGISSVGAPLFGDGSRVVGALAVALPSVRATSAKLRRIADQLRRSAKAASVAQGGDFPTTLEDLPEGWGNPALVAQG